MYSKHLPEGVKRRRISNAVLRRRRSGKNARSESPKWRPIDDFGPVSPWLGPKGAEYFKIIPAEPHQFSEYPQPVHFREADIVDDISERSAYWYLGGKLYFGRKDARPSTAGEAFLPTWAPGSAPLSNKPPEQAAFLCPELYEKLVHPSARLLPEEGVSHGVAVRTTSPRHLQMLALEVRARYEAKQ